MSIEALLPAERGTPFLTIAVPEGGIEVEVVPSAAVVGGGGAPGLELASWSLALPDTYARDLRSGDPVVVGRVERGRLLLDVRCVPAERDEELLAAILSAVAHDGEAPDSIRDAGTVAGRVRQQ